MLSSDVQIAKKGILDKKTNRITTICLGQSGFCFRSLDSVIYIDPYLSDNVEILEGRDYQRQVPIWQDPQLITDANWVVITHNHLDHCDLKTLLPLSIASPQCYFVGPQNVCCHLERHGIAPSRLVTAPTKWFKLHESIRLHAVPAAHPKIKFDAEGCWECVGYIIEFENRKIYHAGDTSLEKSMMEFINQFQPIDTAFLPVNEINYYRNERGIIGNMSIRDAFHFAEKLAVKKLVPMHWDMFLPNKVFRDEIELYYRLVKPSFELAINPTDI